MANVLFKCNIVGITDSNLVDKWTIAQMEMEIRSLLESCGYELEILNNSVQPTIIKPIK